jgi:hypothetical protein
VFEPKTARTKLVGLKVTGDELDALRRAAERSGEPSVSAYLRRIVRVAINR